MRRLRVPAVLAGVAALAILPAAPAFAVDPEVFTHPDSTGVESDGGATATADSIGLHLTTPANARSNFYHYFIAPGTPPEDIDTVVYLASITELSYKTKKIDETPGSEVILPAYKMELYCSDEAPYTTLVYEPYRQDNLGPNDVDYHEWQTWDVDAGEFWSTYQIGDGFGTDLGEKSASQSYQAPLDEILTLCPAGIVISFQVGQGSAPNPGEALADELLFAGAEYSLPVITLQDATSVAAADAPQGEPFAIKHIWRGPLPQLPATGTDVTPYVVAGVTLIALGSALLVVVRRRQVTA